MKIDDAFNLNTEQQRAWESLKKAFKKCHEAKIEIWGELTTLYALDGSKMRGRSVTVGQVRDGDLSVTDNAESFEPKCFFGCAADDGLSIIDSHAHRKPKYKGDD